MSKPVGIGRDSSSDLQVLDPEVSRNHCTVSPGPAGMIRVKDLGSMNGTYYGKTKITEVLASVGDSIWVGQTKLTLKFQGTQPLIQLPELEPEADEAPQPNSEPDQDRRTPLQRRKTQLSDQIPRRD